MDAQCSALILDSIRTLQHRTFSILMIRRYTQPEMGAIWSEQRRYETWLEVELAAADAMAEAGIVPADAARELRAKARIRRRAHRRNRTDHAARRHRLHHRGRRASRAGGALAPLRPDLVRRRRHRAGAADAPGLRPDPQGHRGAARGGAAARRGAPPHADDRPHARRARRADDVRLEARALVRRASARPRARRCAPARSCRSARSPAPSARSRTSIRRSRRASAPASACSRRPSRRRSSSAIATRS